MGSKNEVLSPTIEKHVQHFIEQTAHVVLSDDQVDEYVEEFAAILRKEKNEKAIELFLIEQHQKAIADARMEAEEKEKQEKAQQMTSVQIESALRAKLRPPPNTIEKEPPPQAEAVQSLNTKIDSINERIKEIDERKKQYNQNVQDANKFIKNIESLTEEQKIAQLNGRILALDLQIQKNAERGASMADKNPVQAHKLLREAAAANLQSGSLKDMLSVLEGKKTMCDSNGNPVDSFKDMKYIVPIDKKIVQEEGEYYLLDASQQLHDLSPSEREAAKDKFNNDPELRSVEDLVTDIITIEQEEKSDLQKELAKMQNEIHALQSPPKPHIALAPPADSGAVPPEDDQQDIHTLK